MDKLLQESRTFLYHFPMFSTITCWLRDMTATHLLHGPSHWWTCILARSLRTSSSAHLDKMWLGPTLHMINMCSTMPRATDAYTRFTSPSQFKPFTHAIWLLISYHSAPVKCRAAAVQIRYQAPQALSNPHHPARNKQHLQVLCLLLPPLLALNKQRLPVQYHLLSHPHQVLSKQLRPALKQ